METPCYSRRVTPNASLAAIECRSHLLRTLRNFFHQRAFVEVETPLLASEVIPELHIEPIAVLLRSPESPGEIAWWLQASPELHMKRLLAAGAQAIYQITRSFRDGERGALHNGEFTIVEWYRVGDNMKSGIDLLDELTQTMLGTPPAVLTTYEEAFQRTIGVSPHTATLNGLIAAAKSAGVAEPTGMRSDDRDEWLNLLLATYIEPTLGLERPEILYHYPASQAALARTMPTRAGYEVAERFELYYHGIELANGFHELADAAEQHRRFEQVNAARKSEGRRTLPIPETFLAALAHGLPDCTGVALGFDRLVMLATGGGSVNDVIAFPQVLA